MINGSRMPANSAPTKMRAPATPTDLRAAEPECEADAADVQQEAGVAGLGPGPARLDQRGAEGDDHHGRGDERSATPRPARGIRQDAARAPRRGRAGGALRSRGQASPRGWVGPTR